MINKLIFLFLCLSIMGSSYAQKNINEFKYIIVPTKYDFLDEDDRFQLNSLTKFLFNKNGFTALMSDEPFPQDLKKDNCLALRADVDKLRGMLITKLQVELRDCSNTLIYTSEIGKSKVKQYKTAYNLALRDAFESFKLVKYEYKGKNETSIEEMAEQEQAEIETPEIVEEEMPNKVESPSTAIPVVESVESQPMQVQEDNEKIIETKDAIDDNMLSAKAIFNGFKLYDAKSNEVMTIFDSGVKEVYIVKGKDAIIYKKAGSWIYSETNETNLLTQLIKIDF
ncbi:MAG: hypothetical protein KJP09_08600 [Bacteroidia bacterium]|nr:hypothetical protein [Bacteroidia bacterium]NNK28594.1 hypothetical protein [Flavobacteriaceae bacterium]RZV67277.1 MAG: hypothetical protein EX254_03085 [Flavobacteriaceae bacterium]